MTLLQLVLRFFKVGVIGFGGGSALIPIVRTEVVSDDGPMSGDEYLKHVVVANITPGALPVKLGATCGCQLGGVAGSLLAAYAVAFPGVSACVLIIALFSMLGPQAIHYLNYASLGITVFIVFLLAHYVEETVKAGNFKENVIICTLAFFATNGRVAREILEALLELPRHALGAPLFSISMIHVMILSFYLILYLQLAGLKTAGIGIAIAIAYALLCGDLAKEWSRAGQFRAVVIGLFVLSVVCVWLARKWSGKKKKRAASVRLPKTGSSSRRWVKAPGDGKRRRNMRREIAASVGALLAMIALPIALMIGLGIFPAKGATFLGNMFLSSITSFGGGESYVAVADSIFVQGGYVEAEMFYTRILPVANALPGPILIKVAAAIGFVWGRAGGSLWEGGLLAVSCATLTIGACCCLALVVLNFYDVLRHSQFVMSLKRYILPVICGSLLSTSLAMLYESMKVAGKYGFRPLHAFAAMVACVIATFCLRPLFGGRHIVMLAVWVVVSLVFMTQLAAVPAGG